MRKDYKLERRKYVIGGIVLVIACIYVVRLFSLQVLNDDYKQHADGNAFLKKHNILLVVLFMTAMGSYWFLINLHMM